MQKLLLSSLFIIAVSHLSFAQGNVGIGEAAPNTKLEIKGDGGDLLNIKDSGNDSKLFIDDAGNVGVGTTSPRGKMHIAGDLVTSNSAGTVRKYSSSISSTQSGLFKMGELVTASSSNNVLITGKVYCQSGAVAAESDFSIMVRTNTFPGKNIKFWQKQSNAGISIDLKVYEEPSTGRIVVGFEPSNTLQSFAWDITIFERGNYNYWINENNYTELDPTGLTEIFPSGEDIGWTHGGNTGIGTASPSQKLDVDGNIRVRGLGAGVLSADGSGNITSGNIDWSNISNIPGDKWNGTDNTTGNINRTGNVSIGTSTATRKLEVHDASDIIANFRRTNSNSIGISLEGSSNDITRIYGADKALRVFHTPDGGSSSEVFTIERNGNANFIGSLSLQSGTAVNEFSTDGTLGGNSNNALPTENAVKTYVDAQVGGVTESDPTWSGSANTTGSVGRTGNVGIGTTSPSQLLEVSSASDATILINDEGLRGNALLELNRGDDGRDRAMVVFANAANTDWYAGIPYNCGGNTDQYVISSQGHINDCSVTHTPEFLIDAAGDVGIGVTNPTYKLHVNGRLKTNGINETSDIRFKKNIEQLNNSLEKVMQLNGVSYDWRQDEFPNRKFKAGKDLGVIAQEVEKVLPQVVDTDEEGYKSVQYSHLVPVLIEALKEQQRIIETKDTEYRVMFEQQNERIEKLEALLIQKNYVNNGATAKK